MSTPDDETIDVVVDEIVGRAGGMERFRRQLPEIIQSAIEFVIDPVRTARTSISELDNVEKTFIGLKVEHFFRDFLDIPKGVRDLDVDGLPVDIKHTLRKTWMIPPETYRNAEPCILIMTATEDGHCSLGVFVARPEYLNKPNRDQKRSVSAEGMEHIRWLIREAPLPRSPWEHIDMVLFREVRTISGGTNRAAAFFLMNLNRPVHRTVIETLLFDQKDPLKRLRGNQGARDVLAEQGIALFSSNYDGVTMRALGHDANREHFVAVKPRNRKELEIVSRHLRGRQPAS